MNRSRGVRGGRKGGGSQRRSNRNKWNWTRAPRTGRESNIKGELRSKPVSSIRTQTVTFKTNLCRSSIDTTSVCFCTALGAPCPCYLPLVKVLSDLNRTSFYKVQKDPKDLSEPIWTYPNLSKLIRTVKLY